MAQNMKTLVKKGYDKIEYEKAFRITSTPNPFEIEFLNSVCERIPSKAKILDLGCGIGIPFDLYLVGKRYALTGVDFCHRHVELARKNVPQAEFIEGDFSELSFPQETFDAVISLYAIFHVPRAEHQSLFTRVYQFLKHGGVILLTLGTSDSEYQEETDWFGAPMVWSSFAPREYEKMLTWIGFHILKTNFEGKPGDEEYHFWLLAEKERL